MARRTRPARRLRVRVARPAPRFHLAGGLALTLGVVALVAACGSSSDTSSKSAAAILEASRTAARDASAVRVTSQVFGSRVGPKTKSKPRAIVTLELQLSGGDGHAKLAFFGAKSEVIRIGQTLYVKSGPRFYRRLNERNGTHVPNATWLKAPVGSTEVTNLAALTQPSGELALLLRNPTLALTKGTPTTIDGHKAIELKTKGKLYTGAIYVAATGTPYPLQIVKHGRENALITLSGWNEPGQIAAPSGAVALKEARSAG